MLRNKRYPSKIRLSLPYAFSLGAFFCLLAVSYAQVAPCPFPGPKPADIPQTWKPLIGEYGFVQTSQRERHILREPADIDEPRSIAEIQRLIVLEKSGKLVLREMNGTETRLESATDGTFALIKPPDAPSKVLFGSAARGYADSIAVVTGDEVRFERRKLGPEEGQVFQIQLSRSIDDLRREALAAAPPHENGQFRSPDLVDLAALNAAIHLDIRYATTNDFLGTPVYTQARAFLQRPAAEALVRAQQRLTAYGYALLIHDAYRPWYVTKIFWDATPPEGKIFVADPAQGSRHNRGCAVDLTLYDLKTGKPIEMPGTYDEMSERSFPDYPGGTSLQRWHRDLLRWAMESEGFTVYEHEWWHFDYKDWHEYPILNVPFEKLQFGAAIH
jgi:D-alanyl-D-alanine dipeptidase